MTDDVFSAATRRQFLKGSTATLAGLGASGLLAACGSSSNARPTSSSVAAAGKHRRGGRLRVGAIGAGQAENINPLVYTGNIDITRANNIFDSLTLMTPDLKTPVPQLAEELTPNKDFSAWTVRLRQGVEFTNGKDLTADDLIWTIQGWVNPHNNPYGLIGQFIDAKGVKKLDKLTVRIPFSTPISDPQPLFAAPPGQIYQDGEKHFTHPVGTGPFKLVSFTPGQRSLMTRNPNYWQDGEPYVDELEIISFTDPAALLNALLGGDLDVMVGLDYAQAKAQQSNSSIKLLITPQPGSIPFLMRADVPPFSDHRVRQAMRLIADRKALVETALNGFGTVGNDVMGPGLPYFDSSLPAREQDIEQAKSLLKAAGHEKLTVTLQTSQVVPGFVEAATLFAQQAQAAGVTVVLKQENPAAYFDPSQLYLKMTFAQTILDPITSLSSIYVLNFWPRGPFDETHQNAPTFNNGLIKALGAGPSTAQSAWDDVQRYLYEYGTYLMWGQQDFIDAMAPNVQGLIPDKANNSSNFMYRRAWLS